MAKSNDETAESRSFKEGLAEIALPPDGSSVFYNPVQQFNRDLSVCVLRQHIDDTTLSSAAAAAETRATPNGGQAEPAPKQRKVEEGVSTTRGLTVLDALSASGLRAIRYAREVDGLTRVLANDFSRKAYDQIEDNVKRNELEGRVSVNCGDAVSVMYEHRGRQKELFCIDLDPYGTAAPFLDSAVQAVQDNGLLMVTCTDVAILCGNTPESCYAKYGSMSLKTKSCHEMALRILLRSIDSHANRYGRYIEPLLSLSVDFYVRVFVRLRVSAAKAKNAACNASYMYECSGCHSFAFQPVAKKIERGNSLKYVNGLGPPVPPNCEFCNSRHHVAGPIWTAPIHDATFVSRLLDSVKALPADSPIGTRRRIVGVLSVISEELYDVPLYYMHDQLCNILHLPPPKMKVIRSALLNAGYRVSISHANSQALKTDAPNSILWDILRAYAKTCPDFKMDKLEKSSPAFAILKTEPKFEANFSHHKDCEAYSKVCGLLRFQQNPEPNWGPRPRAKAGAGYVLVEFTDHLKTLHSPVVSIKYKILNINNNTRRCLI